MSDLTAEIVVADKIVPLDELLDRIGHPYISIPGSLRCPVHSGGRESNPSARAYGRFDTVYCFACNRQYGATEIAAAAWGLTRAEAAVKLLEIWVPSEEQKQRILRAAHNRKRPTLDQLLVNRLEKSLRRYRRRVPLAQYRIWAKSINDFGASLLEFPKEYQSLAVDSFLDRLHQDLGNPHAAH